MNVIRKSDAGAISKIRKASADHRVGRDLSFEVGRTSRQVLRKLLVVCGKVGKENTALYKNKAREIGADFISETGSSWVSAHKAIRKNYEPGKHAGILLLGSNKQLPATPLTYQGVFGFTDWFLQDTTGDGTPDSPVGRVFGQPDTILSHMDPLIIDSDIAIIFDSQPGRSTRHVECLLDLGFDVEILRRFTQEDAKLLGVTEFILQFSDGIFTSRIHGTPEKWASNDSVILSAQHVSTIKFQGYPVVYSEACCTAQEGPLLKAFLKQGVCYIGATLDTMNNTEPFEKWNDCPFSDGWKYGFLDLLDTHDLIGQVKTQVDRALHEHLDAKYKREIENISNSKSNELESSQAVSNVEWVLFGNPLRRTTVGPNADFSPGTIVVDT
ncbi:MAG: hypothetical protein V3V85_06445 [Candidatus Thorarchaeota archaeon]